MAFQASTIITRAFYLANILSAQSGETPTSTQVTDAVSLLNQILDAFGDSPYLSSIQKEQLIEDVTTPEIWIGLDIVDTTDATKTVIIEAPYLSIFSAMVSLNNAGNQPSYPLTIYSLAAIAKRFYLNTQAITKSIYWTNLYTSTNGLYTKILLVPSPPTEGSNYTLYGIPGYVPLTNENTTILPNFSSYLEYQLGFELAMLYGKEKEWIESPKMVRLTELQDEIVSNSPIDLTINPTMDAFGRNGIWYRINTPSTS